MREPGRFFDKRVSGNHSPWDFQVQSTDLEEGNPVIGDSAMFTMAGTPALDELSVPYLDGQAVQLWAVSIINPPRVLARLGQLLSATERQRVSRFRQESDRNRFTVGRGFLRLILAAHLDQPAESLSFAYGEHGKPALADEAMGLEFNLSHSGEWVVLGVTRRRSIGVDVECIRAVPELDDLVDRFFAAGESRAIRALAAERRLDGFFACWTRKEAYLKALGAGIGGADLKGFEVTARPWEPASLVVVNGSPELASRWTLWAGAPARGYVAAAAVQGRNVRIVPLLWSVRGVESWPAC